MLEKARVAEILGSFSRLKVLVVGDIMLDKDWRGVVERISPEAPVPILRVAEEQRYLGGAANVANNIRALGAHVELAGIVGEDDAGGWILREAANRGIGHEAVFQFSKACTTLKIRASDFSRNQQIIRMDFEDNGNESTDAPMENSFISLVAGKIRSGVGAVILSDYKKGALTKRVVSRALEEANKKKIKVFVDCKPENLTIFKGAYLVKLNRTEAEAAAREKFSSGFANAEDIIRMLRDSLFSEVIVVTLGQDGMLLGESAAVMHVPAFPREVYDVRGTGDTTLAILALSVVSGVSLREAAELANAGGSVVVSRHGTAICSADDLSSCF